MNRRLGRESAEVEHSGTPVVRIEPDRALREVMGTTTMHLSRRGAVASEAHAHIRRLAASGALDEV